MLILKIILFSFLTFWAIALIIGYLLSSKGYKGPVSPHFDGKKFRNPSGRDAKGFGAVFKYARERKPDKWQKNYETFVRTEPVPPVDENDIQYTFVNHSTFLIQHKGMNILTDPIWSERCSPFQFMGPSRMRPPGLAFEALPRIDLVLVSHNHYDHLDANTIKRIVKKWNPVFVAPLGVSSILKKWGCQQVIELDWWASTQIAGLNIKATPANHFSSRGIFDQNTSLWAGFIIQSDSHKIYYTGDSGYSDIFKTIGEREGPFDLSFIPIGAYIPEWFMSPIHVSPNEAVQIHQDVRSQQSVAMHFGTFPLADDNMERSTSVLKKELEVQHIAAEKFRIPDEGFCTTLSDLVSNK